MLAWTRGANDAKETTKRLDVQSGDWINPHRPSIRRKAVVADTRLDGAGRPKSQKYDFWVLCCPVFGGHTSEVTNVPPDPHQPYGTVPTLYGSPPSSGPAHSTGGFLRRLGPGQKASLFVGGGMVALLLVCCGGVTVFGALTGDPKAGQPAARAQGDVRTSQAAAADSPERAAPPESPTIAAQPSPTSQPQVDVRTVTETQAIAFPEKTVNDPSLAKDTRRVKTRGVAGSKTLTYEVTYTDGVQTAKNLVREVVTKQPVTQVTAVGTKQQQCDPNYSGACVPIASDVDCAGGSGNGPAYVTGPVKVIGIDIYDLDRDGDGWGCE
jgi:hypothetical protein